MKNFKNNDKLSLKIRAMDDVAAHYFLCHSDGSEHKDGCDTLGSHAHLDQYNRAFEEKKEEETDHDEA